MRSQRVRNREDRQRGALGREIFFSLVLTDLCHGMHRIGQCDSEKAQSELDALPVHRAPALK